MSIKYLLGWYYEVYTKEVYMAVPALKVYNLLVISISKLINHARYMVR